MNYKNLTKRYDKKFHFIILNKTKITKIILSEVTMKKIGNSILIQKSNNR